MAKILVADDDPDMLFLIELALTTAGHQVIVASNGDEALVQARRGDVDLLVLDVQMPQLSGLDVTRLVRGDPKLGAVPIVVLTADASEQGRASGYGAGADEYVVKPFVLADLRARVDALLAPPSVLVLATVAS
jgi:DNA-binding response OmpR family regulator